MNISRMCTMYLLIISAALILFACGKERDDGRGDDPVPSMMKGSAEITVDGRSLISMTGFDDRIEARSPAGLLVMRPRPGGYDAALDKESFRVKFREGKIKLLNHDGNPVFTVKRENEKIKVAAGRDEGGRWTLKLKEDKLKYSVREGEKETGMVKYYPDKKAVIAKDDKGKELCRSASPRLIAGPGVCLMSGLQERERLLVFVLLSMAGQ